MPETTIRNLSAFPRPWDSMSTDREGMSIGTYLAGQAMKGLLSNSGLDLGYIECAKIAILYADALIEKLQSSQT